MRVEIGVAWPSKKLAERILKRKRREMSPGLWMVTKFLKRTMVLIEKPSPNIEPVYQSLGFFIDFENNN